MEIVFKTKSDYTSEFIDQDWGFFWSEIMNHFEIISHHLFYLKSRAVDQNGIRSSSFHEMKTIGFK
jgi:hypothetical protein